MALEFFTIKMVECIKANGNLTKCKGKGNCFINLVNLLMKGTGLMINFLVKDHYITNPLKF